MCVAETVFFADTVHVGHGAVGSH